MNRLLTGIGLVVVLALIGFSLTAYTVDERERAILFRLGEMRKVDIQPGLHFRIPVYHTVERFEARVQTLDRGAVRYQTRELKNVVVDAFVKWRIDDLRSYFVSVGRGSVNSRLGQIIDDLSRNEFGKRTVEEVVSGERDEIVSILRERLAERAQAFGVEVIDVRLRRVDLPAEVSNSVYERMEAERSRVAAELRAEGREEGERIRSQADRERTVILAEAEREAQRVRGEGDATATTTYARAYERDPEFYAFYRSLDAYENILRGDDVMVLKPDNAFFRYFAEPYVAKPAPSD